MCDKIIVVADQRTLFLEALKSLRGEIDNSPIIDTDLENSISEKLLKELKNDKLYIKN